MHRTAATQSPHEKKSMLIRPIRVTCVPSSIGGSSTSPHEKKSVLIRPIHITCVPSSIGRHFHINVLLVHKLDTLFVVVP